MTLTEPVNFINKPLVSYFVAGRFSSHNIEPLQEVIDAAKAQFGDALFAMPTGALHVTVLDWISPVNGYGGISKSKLYEQLSPSFDAALTKTLATVSPITVNFSIIKASPSTIFITGYDSGEFAQLRQNFIDKVDLSSDTKRPPSIIHSSLARFTKQIDFADVEKFVSKQTINITQTFDHFDLLLSSKEPTLEFTVLRRYELGGESH